MESNLSFFSLPFVDNADVDFSKIKGHECDYDDLHPTLPSHGSLLGADDVLAQFLSGDELLEEPDLNGPTTLHCEICRKQFDNAKKYYGHLRVHSKDNLWICEKCPNEKFSTKQNLMKHTLSHKPLERVWRCPQCEMAFEALWRLQQHLFSKHLNYRPHKCDKCEMAFHKLSDLKQHKDVHGDIKKHGCTLCSAKFKDMSNLKRHMNCHSKEKPYPCVGCGNRYSQLASLKRHTGKCALVKEDKQAINKGIRKNYCRVCGATFQYKSALLEHCVRQHSNNPPPPNSIDTTKAINSNSLHVATNRLKIDTDLPVNTNKNPYNVDPNQTVNIENPNNIVLSHSADLINSSSNKDTNQSNTSILDTNRTVNMNNGLLNTNHSENIDINANQPIILSNILINSGQNLLNIDDSLTANQPERSNADGQSVIVNPSSLNIDPNRITNVNNNLDINRSLNITDNLNIDPTRPLNIDTNRTVDNIVDDILSAEDDYLRDPLSSQMINYNQVETDNPDNLMHIELLKEMNHMHILDDELLYNDIDFDSFQTMCNTNDMDYTDRNELLFDIADGRSIDQDIMNALYQVKGDNIPDDLLNETEILNPNEKVNDYLANPAVSVNECATIFESDVDLEASTNLAANLNQLIGENSVQYISTEHDDTFIISLNSEIDAEQLTDMLNIGVGPVEENKVVKETIEDNIETPPQPIVVTIENMPQNDDTPKPNQIIQPILVRIDTVTNKENVDTKSAEVPKSKKKVRKKVHYVCRICNKIFKRKDNYKSHRATHDSSLSNHKCHVCGERFGYKSTLNKHVKKKHTPLVVPAHRCDHCHKTYQMAWMLKRHLARDHELNVPFECTENGCGKKFYEQRSLDAHKRFHANERPYTCDICNRGFFMQSHLKRHIRKVDCTKHIKKAELNMKKVELQTGILKLLS